MVRIMYKIILMKDNDVLAEFPLDFKNYSREEIVSELRGALQDLSNVIEFYEALLNENRARLLMKLIEDDDFTLSFAEIIRELGLNPKLIREHAFELKKTGLIDIPMRGKYRLCPEGLMKINAMVLTMRKIFREIEKILEEEVM